MEVKFKNRISACISLFRLFVAFLKCSNFKTTNSFYIGSDRKTRRFCLVFVPLCLVFVPFLSHLRRLFQSLSVSGVGIAGFFLVWFGLVFFQKKISLVWFGLFFFQNFFFQILPVWFCLVFFPKKILPVWLS